MSTPVIRVENISKLYRLGKKEERAGTLMHALMQFASTPVRNFRRLRSLTHFEDAADADDILWALKDVSFDIAQGDVVGIIGNNGAGKSTMLKILSRITRPTSGRAEIHGRLASLLEVGTGFHPELSGRDNIYLNGAILGMSRKEVARKFDEIVAFSEVEKFLDTPVKRYSSGMYVRLAFSVAAHLEPDILVIDEVLAVGDSSFQKKCLDKMNESSRKDGRTIICVSHNMAMMKALCNSIIWFELGKIKAIGKTEALVSEYLQVSVQKTKTLTNLRDYQRNDADGTQLRIVSLEWLSPLPVTHTERFAVRITFEAYSDIKAVAVGIGISTVEGMRLLTYDMDDPGEPLDVVHGKTYSVSLDIENLPIPPGIYSVDIGARAGPILGLDYLPGCLKIDIFPGKRTALHQKKDRAGVRLPSVWQVESL